MIKWNWINQNCIWNIGQMILPNIRRGRPPHRGKIRWQKGWEGCPAAALSTRFAGLSPESVSLVWSAEADLRLTKKRKNHGFGPSLLKWTFLKKNSKTRVLFVGPLIPLFWTSGDVSPGFHSQGRFLACMLSCLCAIPQIHLWGDTCWLYWDQHSSWSHSLHATYAAEEGCQD